ncbi:MAG: TA system VapC family ribonuclease toxin [Verrucomicrobiota bacterium]
MLCLADINVLIALADPAHAFHAAARKWLAARPRLGLATCPLTENGFLRIYGHPSYPGGPGSPAQALLDLRVYRRRRGHRFLPCDLSFDDPAFLDLTNVTPRQLTDLYLVALAAHNQARFVTFDTAVPVSRVKAGAAAIEVIPVSP